MRIVLEDVGKKYNRDWIFKGINLEISPGQRLAVTGPNGSGKSTLIQVIAGNLLCTKGQVAYKIDGIRIDPAEVYSHLFIVAPYLELPDDLELAEFLKFHFQFRKIRSGCSIADLPELFQLEGNEHKRIRYFSTGMKQRLKLGSAFYSDVPLMLLDEPATNLDSKGMQWYLRMVESLPSEQVLVVCSNRSEEYVFCNSHLDLLNFK